MNMVSTIKEIMGLTTTRKTEVIVFNEDDDYGCMRVVFSDEDDADCAGVRMTVEELEDLLSTHMRNDIGEYVSDTLVSDIEAGDNEDLLIFTNATICVA